MQNENDHIEDLFRRAAESYPLKTSSSNWNDVAAKLDAQEEKTDKPVIIFFNKYKMLTGLLLLLLVGSAGYLLYNSNIFSAKIPNKVAVEKPSPVSSPNILSDKNSNEPATAKRLGTSKSQNQAIDLKKMNATSQPRLHAVSSFSSKGKLNAFTIGSPFENNNDALNNVADQKLDYNLSPFPVEHYANLLNNSLIINGRSQLQLPEDNSPLKSKKVKPEMHKSWRLSFIAGVDKSNIKQQQYSNVGASFGVTIGYSVNHWLIETGLLYDKKYYYSDGKYFNPKVAINPYWKIIDLNGNCNMFEIPLNIGYNIKVTSNNALTFKAGLSSYLMNQEMYDYNYKSYGMVYSATAKYKSNIKNWFAVTNASLNYNHRLNNTTFIGLELYIKIPVNNIGTGRMPISSSGINLSVSKKL